MPSKQLRPSPANVSDRLVLWIQVGIVSCFCAWTLLLPVFPSQDGPIHLMYTAVLRHLLFSHGSHFEQFFTVKHLLPPYSLYYYLLMGLGEVVPLAMADKLVVCLYMISFSFGLRYLARPLGPSGGAMALLATPLLFNWALLTGLTSFLLSTTLVFWAAGLWSRSAALRSSPARRIGFGVLLFLITLTHPVPLLLLGGYCVLELGIRVLPLSQPQRTAPKEPRQRLRHALLSDVSLLLGFAISFLYVLHFAREKAATQAEAIARPGLLAHLKETVRFELELASILPFRGGSALPLRLLWLLTLVGIIGLIVWNLRQKSRRADEVVNTSALAWTGMLLFFLLALPFIPDDVGGGHNFAYRMMLYVWITAFAAASMASHRLDRVRLTAVILALLLSAQTLFLAQRYIRPLAVEIARAPAFPPEAHGQAGLQLAVPRYREARVTLRNKLSFDPFQWAAAGLFRRADAVLLDSPWLEESVLPLGAEPALPAAQMPASAVEDDRRLRQYLEDAAAEQRKLLSQAAFVVVVNGLDTLPTEPDPLLQGWNCQPQQWYSFCARPGNAFGAAALMPAARPWTAPSRSRAQPPL